MISFFVILDGVIKFTSIPPNPSYARNGTDAKLVWDYSVDNPQAELNGITYSVKEVSGGSFINMLGIQTDGTVTIFSQIPNEYKGRVRIEGRASLVIEKVTFQDNTQFMCTLVTKPGAGRDQSSNVQLIIAGMYFFICFNCSDPLSYDLKIIDNDYTFRRQLFLFVFLVILFI